MNIKRVLFVCTHNSARSQMAEALLNNLDGEHYQAYSAGTEPGGVNLYTREVMEEIGIDMAKHRSKSIQEFIDMGMEFDVVVTVCDSARESCPYFPGGRNRMHRSFEDPSEIRGSSEEIMDAFRRIRDEIAEWIEEEFL